MAAEADADGWRILADAQREADTMFALYQLSQLLASGETLEALAAAVLEELVRITGAAVGTLWLAPRLGSQLELVAAHADREMPSVKARAAPPERFETGADARTWCQEHGWFGVTLDEGRDGGTAGPTREAIGLVAVAAPSGGMLASDHARLLGLVRHELGTALRAAQLRDLLVRDRATLTSILDGASDAIVAVDADRRVVRLNPAATALLDVAEPIGRSCAEVLGCHGPSRPTSDPLQLVGRGASADRRPGAGELACGERCPFGDVLAGGNPIAGRERDLLGREGPVPIAGSYALMPGGGGAVGVLRDLRPTRELDDLKSGFVAAVSHELRTPLALISGYVQTLVHIDVGRERERHYLQQILSVTERLTGLVNQILEISRLDSDRVRLDVHPTSVEAIVGSAVGEFGEGASVPPISVSLSADLPALNGDAERLARVVANLLANAAKYAGAGAAIGVTARATDNGEVVITVADNGPGIPDDERQLVFERFYRGRAVGRSGVPGSGLGLYLCRRVVEAHGGAIWLDDVPTGASVSFSVPAAPDAGPHGLVT